MTSEKGALYSLTRETGATVPLTCLYLIALNAIVRYLILRISLAAATKEVIMIRSHSIVYMELSDYLNQKGFHCAYLNSCSLFNKLKTVSQMLHHTILKLHVLGLSETWVNEQIPDSLVTIEGYDLLMQVRSHMEAAKLQYC